MSESTKKKIAWVISLCIWGYIVFDYLQGVPSDSSLLEGWERLFVRHNIGFGVLIPMLLFLWAAGVGNPGTQKNNTYLMCPECGSPATEEEAPARLCPACNAPLEDMKGFYERHPQFKENDS